MNSHAQVRSNFPGGNIILDSISDGVVRVRPDQRDTDGTWFYWCFEVTAGSPGTLLFQFPEDGKYIGPRGPAVSVDGGENWEWLSPEPDFPENSFSYRFHRGGELVRFSLALPYTRRELDKFLSTLSPEWSVQTLCVSRGGRVVPLLSVPRRGERQPTLILTARQHACEVTASYVLEGLVHSWLKNETSPPLVVLPFMDCDGVELGDQGKLRRPRDHNRDYTVPTLYAETGAVMQLAAGLEGSFAVLDLHCPWLRGGINEMIYLVGSPCARMEALQRAFAVELEKIAAGLPFVAENFVPYGTDWNVQSSFARGKTLTNWASEQAANCFNLTLEIPYSNASGVAISGSNARDFGSGLALALQRFLRGSLVGGG